MERLTVIHLEYRKQLTRRIAAVADGVFLLWRQFGAGAAVLIEPEEWVVAEAVGTAACVGVVGVLGMLRCDDSAFKCPADLDRLVLIIRPGDRDRADESRSALIRRRVAEFFKEFLVVGGVNDIPATTDAGVPRADDARCAAERINFEAPESAGMRRDL